jgi:hypothetical protein
MAVRHVVVVLKCALGYAGRVNEDAADLPLVKRQQGLVEPA